MSNKTDEQMPIEKKSFTEKIVLHRAPLVVPVQGPVLENGAVLVGGNRILQVDSYDRLRGEADQVIDHEGAVLVPALMNCHAHVELSHLRELGQDNSFFAPGDICCWIEALLESRVKFAGDPLDIEAAARNALQEMRLSGVAGLVDIGNSAFSRELGRGISVVVQFFLEGFGLSSAEVPEIKKRLAESSSLSWTGHAPYSTSPELLIFLKERAKARGQLFPIHTAESSDEIEFLQTGRGRFADFLSKRLKMAGGAGAGDINDIFSPPGCGSISYLNDLGILDKNTLCVHSVHVSDPEIDLLAKHGASVCLCPASNRFLGVGVPPVSKFIAADLNICLGSDSLASNKTLNIWHEMRVLAGEHPDIDPELIFQMATCNGAAVMGLADVLGGLQPGKSTDILSLRGLDLSEKTIYESLVQRGHEANIKVLRENEL